MPDYTKFGDIIELLCWLLIHLPTYLEDMTGRKCIENLVFSFSMSDSPPMKNCYLKLPNFDLESPKRFDSWCSAVASTSLWWTTPSSWLPQKKLRALCGTCLSDRKIVAWNESSFIIFAANRRIKYAWGWRHHKLLPKPLFTTLYITDTISVFGEVL